MTVLTPKQGIQSNFLKTCPLRKKLIDIKKKFVYVIILCQIQNWKIEPKHLVFMQGSQHEFSFGGRGDFLLNTPTVVALQCQISKSCCTKVNLLFLEKYTTRCTLLSLLFIKLWPIKHLFFSDYREISPAQQGRVEAQENLSLSLSKNSI